jgi:uncharacterized membrane protein YeaQ/YmgE (transglycosylase-associated protein family)
MGVITWIILGLIAGFIASKILNRTGSGLLLDLVIFSGLFGMSGINGLDIWSTIVPVIGAIIVLWVYEALVAKPFERRLKRH